MKTLFRNILLSLLLITSISFTSYSQVLGNKILPQVVDGVTEWPDIDLFSYDSKSFATSPNTAPFGARWNPDGSILNTIKNGGAIIYENLPTVDYDLGTVTYNAEITITGASAFTSLTWYNGGSNVILATQTTLYQFSCSTPGDLDTATYDSVSYSHGVTWMYGMFWGNGGLDVYLTGTSANLIYRHSTGTPYDISDLSSTSNSGAWADSPGDTPFDCAISPTGLKFWVIMNSTEAVEQWILSTPWDITSKTYDSKLLDISSEANNPRGMDVKPDGTKIYTTSFSIDLVHQYGL